MMRESVDLVWVPIGDGPGDKILMNKKQAEKYAEEMQRAHGYHSPGSILPFIAEIEIPYKR